jgi:3-oxoadipate enol-lactonase
MLPVTMVPIVMDVSSLQLSTLWHATAAVRQATTLTILTRQNTLSTLNASMGAPGGIPKMPSLHFETSQPGADCALMLIHPLGGDLRSWDAVRALWGERYAVVACDLPGAGRSPVPAEAPTPTERVATIEALRVQLGLRQIVPVGVAIGAMIAALYAAAHPEHTRALVLGNPAIAISPTGRDMTHRRIARLREGGMAALSPEVVDLAFNAMPHDAEYDAYLARFKTQDPRGYEMSALSGLQIDLTGTLPQITCPTLVVYGDKDVLFPPAEAAKVAAAITDASIKPLPNAAHFPPVQDAAGFASAIDEFLIRHGAFQRAA